MKLKMKLMAAAVALVAASGANAAMSNFASGNGTLAFIALDNIGTPMSVMMDLNYDINTFTAAAMSAPGTKIQWNFNTNTLMVNGVNQGVAATWSGDMSVFAGATQANQTKWAVIAGDSTGSAAGEVRYLTTSNTALTTLQTQTKGNLAGFSGVDALFNANNSLQPNAIDGSTATSLAPFVNTYATSGAFKWQNKFIGDSFANEGTAQKFYQLDTFNGTTSSRAKVTQYANLNGAADFSYSAGVLTFAAPVPEPETYALMLAGLGMIGFMARRRLNSRA